MTHIGTVYGQALYALAKDEQLDEAILPELEALSTAFSQQPEFIRLLATPNLPKETRCRVVDDSFRGRVQPYVLNFLKLLTEKGYIRHFSGCVDAYRAQYQQDHNILPVKAVTAVPLTPEHTQRLTEKLSKLTGKTILLTNSVEPDCLGGVRLDYDGRRVEDTVAHRLAAIRNALKTTVL